MAHEPETVMDKSLEFWLSRATDPFLAENLRPEYVAGFCEQVNLELEGQIIACRLLAHKIQSPHEKEALNSLEVLDMCVKNCGQRFHNEIAKFKFLNEVIKILSPKYLGSQTSDKVKTKAIEMLYSWKISLRHLPKIKQAYDMLKEQNIVVQDPVCIDEVFETPPLAPKPKLASFEDDDKARLLSQLLKSKNPDDLQAANRLIKSMVKAEDHKIERISKRSTNLDMANNNSRLLIEMIAQFDKSTTMQQEMEIMKELAESLHKLRPILFRYAGEAAEGDENVLAEILAINDDVGKVLDDYRSKVEPFVNEILNISFRKTSGSAPISNSQGNSLLDFDSQTTSKPVLIATKNILLSTSSSSSDCNFLGGDDVLMIGGGGTPLFNRKMSNEPQTSALTELKDIFGSSITQKNGNHREVEKLASSPADASNATGSSKAKGLLDLDALSDALIQQNLPTGVSSTNQQQQSKKLSLRDLNQQKEMVIAASLLAPFSSPGANPSDPQTSPRDIQMERGTPRGTPRQPPISARTLAAACPATPHSTPEVSCAASPVQDAAGPLIRGSANGLRKRLANVPLEPATLDDVPPVTLESIRPATQKTSLTVVDRQRMKIVLHYTANKPRCDVTCVLASISSQWDQPLTEIHLIFRVLDLATSAVKTQTASATSLPAHNPILPQSAITQIFLFTTSGLKERVPVEFSLNFKANEKQHSIDGFIDVDCS